MRYIKRLIQSSLLMGKFSIRSTKTQMARKLRKTYQSSFDPPTPPRRPSVVTIREFNEVIIMDIMESIPENDKIDTQVLAANFTEEVKDVIVEEAKEVIEEVKDVIVEEAKKVVEEVKDVIVEEAKKVVEEVTLKGMSCCGLTVLRKHPRS